MKPVTMQHDLFVNPSRRGRADLSAVVDLQADVVDGDSRIVAPLTTTAIVPDPPDRASAPGLCTMARLCGDDASSGILPARHLGAPVGSIAQHRDDLTRALDWLFFGI